MCRNVGEYINLNPDKKIIEIVSQNFVQQTMLYGDKGNLCTTAKRLTFTHFEF